MKSYWLVKIRVRAGLRSEVVERVAFTILRLARV